MEEGKRNRRRIKKKKNGGGVFCPSAHKKVTISQINPPPLSIVQPLMTSDPSISESMLKQRKKKEEGGRKGKHTHPESAVTKGGLSHS